jgi:hypothetical protein
MISPFRVSKIRDRLWALGLPHIGTFGEVAAHHDGAPRLRGDLGHPHAADLLFRRHGRPAEGADNVPNQEMLAEDLHLPLTRVRDPFGTHESFGAHNNARLRAFLDSSASSTSSLRRPSTTRPALRRDAAALGRYRQDHGHDAADAGRGTSRDLFALPADQPEDGPCPPGADAGTSMWPRARSSTRSPTARRWTCRSPAAT